MTTDKIIIKGARQHNLKNIDLELPREKLIVITGLSGSGKSSLAFDTIYAEGQRRYVESLSAYARQFLEQMDKPDVDQIIGLSPAIAIQQKALSRNPRSTVGTVTEIYDYLRLLFARIGIPHCPKCGKVIKPQSAQQIVNELMSLPAGTKIVILSPVVKGRKGEYRELFKNILQKGFVRAKIDGKIYELENPPKLEKFKKHDISVVIDRLVISPDVKSRLAESVETALKLSSGIVIVETATHKQGETGEIGAAGGTGKTQRLSGSATQSPNLSIAQSLIFSEHHSCADCGISIPEISPRFFSFNAPYGACPECDGIGEKIEVAEPLVVPDSNLSINNGAIVPWSKPITTKRHRWSGAWSNYYYSMLEDVSRRHGFSMDTQFKKLSSENQEAVLYGDGDFEGVITNLERRYRETESEFVREEIYNKYMRSTVCEKCRGRRLKDEALAVTVGGKNISEVTQFSIKSAREFFANLKLNDTEKIISKEITKEINSRLSFLENVGLDYITLDRESSSLSGGEAQRIHLATHIGSGLVGVLYVLDEPTIGLHQRDNQRLLNTLFNLRNLGNTLIVVEHDEATIRSADYVVDLGPGAGEHGGKVVFAGKIEELLKSRESLTGKYLRGEMVIPVPHKRQKKPEKFLEIKGASQFNLKNINVKVPIGLFTAVTGVSGSGKSTLIYEILYKALCKKIYNSKEMPGSHKEMGNSELIDKIILVDQSPIGRTPRSNPVTYTGVFAFIRDLFSKLPQSKMKGYKPGRFSFNVKGGRCESCQGDGTKKIEMQFLADVYVKCEVCKGARFNEETLSVKYKGKNIAEVLDMSVEEALAFFGNIPHIKKILQTLMDVGLGYIKLGQQATTLSGGEAQRVKLASELGKRATGKTIYILDEPTTGLHFADIEKLLEVLHRLVDNGNTIVVIEHNLDVIKTADWVIDLGPEGGDAGGEVVFQGEISKLLKSEKSHTAKFLSNVVTRESSRK